jgi:hypothetical protein
VKKVGVFFGAMLYGTCWVVGLMNLAALMLGLPEGQNPFNYLSMILMPLAIILYIHHLAGWFPFGRQA